MTILYALVARGDIVLAEYSNARGNFVQVTRELLKRIDAFSDRKMSYAYTEQIHYHILVEGGLTYLGMASHTFQKRRAFAFLLDVRQNFLTKFGETWKTAIALQFDNIFSRTLQQRAEFFSSDASDKIAAVQAQIEETKSILVENIDNLLARGERIELLVEKTERLTDESFQFKNKARQLRIKMWWKNIKLWLIIGGIIIVVIFLIVWFSCGFPDFHMCGSGSSSPSNSPPGPPGPPSVPTPIPTPITTPTTILTPSPTSTSTSTPTP